MAATTTADLDTAVQAARADVLEARRVLSSWQTQHDQAVRALEELEETAGERILASVDGAEQVQTLMTELRTTIRTSELAMAAQQPRVEAAEAAYLHAEANLLEQQVDGVRRQLDKHEKETARLLAALERHDGRYQPVAPGRTKSAPLRQELRQVEMLRAFAGGVDPREWIRSLPGSATREPVPYPACLTAQDAVVPPPETLERLADLRRTLVELEPAQRALVDEIEEWRDKVARQVAGFTQQGVNLREAQLENITAELERARAALAPAGELAATTAVA